MIADYYATLGVARTTEDVVIRAAYLALMRRYHPDTNSSPAAAERARAITAAYEVLSDWDKRAEYDRRRATEAAANAPRSWLRDIPVGPTAFAAIMLLLLLLLWVVWSQRPMRQQPDRLTNAQDGETVAEKLNPAASCASRTTNDLIKQELFRRAAQLREGDRAAFERLGAYSFVRIDSPLLAKDDEEPGTVSCRASIVVNLPPGVAVRGGQRTLMAEIGYSLKAAAGGNRTSIFLSNGDRIARPLATLRGIPLPAVTPDATEHVPANVPPPAIEPAPVPVPPRLSPSPSRPKPLPRPQARVEPESAPLATASFNCRFAKARWEITVCNNGNLAALDRHLALLHSQSWAHADAAKREALLRTRNPFITRRDECRSETCIRDVFLGRMKEVADIMTGQSQPPR